MEKLIQFLRGSSEITLQTMLLNSCADRANKMKQMVELLDEIVDAEAVIRFAEWKLQESRAGDTKLELSA